MHNQNLRAIRRAFVAGAYYPAPSPSISAGSLMGQTLIRAPRLAAVAALSEGIGQVA
jgi:hypothetical protein